MPSHLLYIADPMCSWCWGFSPVMDAVRDHFDDKLPMRLLMGGLRPGTTEPMSEAMKSDIKGHWKHVQEASGQPFDFSFFDREGFIYDTEPASRAVVVVRRIKPDRMFDYFKSIQDAFYARNLDVTHPEVLAELAARSGLDREAFTTGFKSEEAIKDTWREFETSRGLGVTRFPTLLAGSEKKGYQVITAGYRPWEKIKELITDYGLRNNSLKFEV